MSDLFEDDAPSGTNAPEFTVSEIAGRVRKVIEGELGWVRVRGEVGRVVHARSGHLYFDLKDDKSVLSCMTWKGQLRDIGTVPEEGMEVFAEGRMTASGMQSKFSLNAQRVAIAGEGALMAMLEKRKKALAAEGLFDEARKKPLPYLPNIIGVVTSPQGAVIRDILHRLRARFPRKVLVWPVAVQGERCAPDVVRAIEGFNGLTPGGALPRPDLLIVARGGGSIEDLWGFNEEAVARAAAASAIPLISAVGHETDTTLIDFAADRRAPTPTAAAEMAVPVRAELQAGLDGLGARALSGLDRGLAQKRQRLSDLSRALPRAEMLIADPRQRLDLAEARLPAALNALVARRRAALFETGAALQPQRLRAELAARADRLAVRGERLRPALARSLLERGRALDALAQRLRPETRRRAIQVAKEQFGAEAMRLAQAGQRRLEAARTALQAQARVLDTLGYGATLARGYAVVWDGKTLVDRAEAAKGAFALEIEFADGRLPVAPTAPSAPTPTKKPRAKTPSDPGDQGSLF
ncbi:MAG: exodeoxyribonuclease VII large subunit [Pseudomonadota bacterium]